MDVNSKKCRDEGQKDDSMYSPPWPLLIQTSHTYGMGNSNESPFLEVRW